MNQKSITILFYLNKAKTNQRGVCPIYCRITYRKKRKQFSTGEFIDPSNWNAKKQKAGSNEINLQLQLIKTNVKKAYLLFKIGGDNFTIQDIFQNYVGKPSYKEVGTVTYFREFLTKMKALIAIDMQLSTWKKFNYVCSYAQDFIKFKYAKNDLPLNKLKLDFL